MAEKMIIDLSQLEGPIYSGRDRGRSAREQFGLDELNLEEADVTVVVPQDTYSVTSSFFLGMFGPLLIEAGSTEAFLKHIHFDADDELGQQIGEYATRAFENKSLLDR